MARGEAQSGYTLGVPGIYMGAPTWLCEPPMGANQTEKRSGAEPRAKETAVAAEPSETSTSRRGPKSTACMHIRVTAVATNTLRHAPQHARTDTHTHTHTQMPCTHVQIENLTCFPLNALGTARLALRAAFSVTLRLCRIPSHTWVTNNFSLQSVPCLLQDSRSHTRGVLSHE